MVTAFELDEAVREARARTGVPGVAAGVLVDGAVALAADGVLELGGDDPVQVDTPFRIASITKSFTSGLCFACLEPDERVRALLSHTAGLRCDSRKPLPDEAQGLFSYSNSGYIEAGHAAAEACGASFDAALVERVLAPLGLDATTFEEPPRPARGHVQEGETGHRLVARDLYRPDRRAAGGLWSTAADLLAYGAAQMTAANPAHEPRVAALGAHYAYGWWVRELADGRTAIDHEGSVAGYQSILLLVPADGFALTVLTNSWRGSGLIRRVVEALGLIPRVGSSKTDSSVEGTYVLDSASAVVERNGEKLFITERDLDPVTGDETLLRYPVSDVGDGVFGFARGALMSHRLDFPRPGVARIGWTTLSAR